MQCHPYIEDIDSIRNDVSTWKDLEVDQIKFERLTGLSNKIYKVTCTRAGIVPEAVIFRKFGQSALVDRHRENYILKGLADQGAAAKFFGGSNDYRIEKYYENTHLTPSELNGKTTRRRLAKVLGEFHRVQLPELDGKASFLKELEGKSMIKMVQEKAIKNTSFTPEEKKLLEDILTLTRKDEISFLKSILPKKAESVVFSHNDLHSENVLNLTKNNRLLLIDFEYSDYNYRGYDIANFFNEMLFEYSTVEQPFYIINKDKFPSHDDLADFVQYYLLFSKFRVKNTEVEALLEDEEKLTQYIIKNYDIDTFHDEIEELIREVKVCSLLSHYYWILWSVVMSKRPDIKFDYILYAHERFEIYQELKKKYFGLRASRQNSLTN